jgi:hypothetical protein
MISSHRSLDVETLTFRCSREQTSHQNLQCHQQPAGQQPAASSQQAGIDSGQVTAGTDSGQRIADSSQQPAAGTDSGQQPADSSQQPADSRQQPGIDSRQRAAASRQQAVEAASSEQPGPRYRMRTVARSKAKLHVKPGVAPPWYSTPGDPSR